MAQRIVFAGTPEFAVPSLAALLAAGHEVAAVYCQPDRPAGRGRALRACAVKTFALAHDLPVRQPTSLKSELPHLRSLAPDVMVVVAYGLILPAAILTTPRLGCVNVHASLLPRWRGAAPIQRAIEAGDSDTGITIMQMDAGLDTGDMLASAQIPITDTDTAGILHDRLAELGAATLVTVLADLAAGRITPRAQDEALACYAPKLNKAEANIDWRMSAPQIVHKINALNPWPIASTRLRGKVLRIWQASAQRDADVNPPGTVMHADREGIVVASAQGQVVIQRLQVAGSKPMMAADFLNGHTIRVGDRFTD